MESRPYLKKQQPPPFGFNLFTRVSHPG